MMQLVSAAFKGISKNCSQACSCRQLAMFDMVGLERQLEDVPCPKVMENLPGLAATLAAGHHSHAGQSAVLTFYNQ
jgi:hypothetical protein